MKEYLNLVEEILEKGYEKTDRTGTGTKSIFGYQMRFDLSKGFPLLTTKKLFLKGIIHELLWFLKGETNIQYLLDNNVHIWDEWSTETGELGPVYGEQWRSIRTPIIFKKKTFQQEITSYDETLVSGVGICDIDVTGDDLKLKELWEHILKQCYSNKNRHCEDIHVDETWHILSSFISDVKTLENYDLKCVFWDDYILDCEYSGSNKFSKDTCLWISKEEKRINQINDSLWVYEHDNGNTDCSWDIISLCKKYSINFDEIGKDVSGWKLYQIKNNPEYVIRIKIIDQIVNLIKDIKTKPDSRRHIVSGWNPVLLPNQNISPQENVKCGLQALPPCHTLFQFYVANGRLSCQLYQRSADLALGVPYNIASYSLLTMMIAQVCDLEPGDFIHTFGDVHIYNNHIDGLKEQLTRTPLKLPTMELNREIRNINDFTYEDFQIKNYECYPTIKFDISV